MARYVPMPLTLETVRQDIEDRLSEAASNRRSPMHTPVVATADADARIMVLRNFDRDEWTLRFHTDIRSPKVEMLEDNPAIAVLFYDRDEKIQIRCRGHARIENESPLAISAWEASDTYARRCYLGAPPGEERDEPSSGLPDDVEGKRPTEDELAPARRNFAALIVKIESADWYFLSNDGHRRAIFTNGKGSWVTP
tara:strand:+ start:577 stop:1164 length:588 start_codon:yes stop_codon:yes gene_type:complete